MIRVDREQRQLFVLKHHIHHGVTGLALMAIGAILVVHDWPDRRRWLTDLLVA